MSKQIDDLDELSYNQLLIRNNHSKFDLETFMNHNSISEAAVLLITPSQFIITDCFIESSYGQGFYSHADTMKAIYSSICIDLTKIKNNKKTLEDLIINDSNIFILLCNEPEVFNIIGFPEVVSNNQYGFLVVFNNEIKKIYQNNKNYFERHPMQFTTYHDIDGCHNNSNNIDSILRKLKKNISCIPKREEIILGSSLEKLDINMESKNLYIKSKILKKKQ